MTTERPGEPPDVGPEGAAVFLSLVIPAHNEERRLPATFDRIRDFLKDQPYRAEVLVIENASSDGTWEVANAAAGRDPDAIGVEGGCAMAGKSAAEWLGRLRDWQSAGASHLCLRTLDGGLDASAQLELMREARRLLDAEGIAP